MSDSKPKVYLAGPEVFHADARAIGARKKEVCTRYGLEGLFPLDNEVEVPDDAEPAAIAAHIYAANIDLVKKADGIVANVSPFLGALADDGTAFEIGYGVARGIPIALYDNGTGCTSTKASEFAQAAPQLRDSKVTAEDFQLPVNLMLSIAAVRSCGIVEGGDVLPMADLSRFEEAVKRMAVALQK